MQKRICIILSAFILLTVAALLVFPVFSDEDTPSSGNTLDKTGWVATVNSDYSTTVKNILDNKPTSYWHSAYTVTDGKITAQDHPPYHLIISMPTLTKISGIMLTPRPDSNSAGRILRINLYVSDTDDGEFTLLEENISFENNVEPKSIDFLVNLTVKRVWVEVIASVNGFGVLGEFDALAPSPDYADVSFEEYAEAKAESMMYPLDKTAFTASYTGDNWQSHVPQHSLDGTVDKFWQTEAISRYPISLTIDMKKIRGVKEIAYTPRQTDDLHGCWLSVHVLFSVDGTEWTSAGDRFKLEKNLETKLITLENEIFGRYLRFDIYNAHGGRAAAAELDFYQTKAAKDAYEAQRVTYRFSANSPLLEVTSDGSTREYTLNHTPKMADDTLMLPLDGVLQQMGIQAAFHPENETMRLTFGAYELNLQIWNQHLYIKDPVYGNIRCTFDIPPMYIDSAVYIPAEYLLERLGFQCTLSSDGSTITVGVLD